MTTTYVDILAALAERGAALAAAPPMTAGIVNLSADLRYSGYKLTPVDVNFFPGGWHNLCPSATPRIAEALRVWVAERYPGLEVERVVLLAEWMDRNPAYVANLARIGAILEAAGWRWRVAALLHDLPPEGVELVGLDDVRVRVHALEVDAEGHLWAGPDFRADWVLNNNDFHAEIPEWLLAVATPIDPPPQLGWACRRKRDFFAAYAEEARIAAEAFDLDPWSLIPETEVVEPVDFWHQEGLDQVAEVAEALLDRIADAYRERGIADRPFVVVKDEAGTFGMGVITVTDPAILRRPNRKLRQRMQRGKGGRPIRSVLVQEGVYTRDVIDDCAAEPVVMAVGGRIAGAFFRYHCEKEASENLNARGMVFARLCFGGQGCPSGCVHDEVREHAYRWCSRLILAAATREIALHCRAGAEDPGGEGGG